MAKKAIVIGSGIGGLACALELARHNYKVTILEKNSLPGGYCSSFTKKGYTFDIGPHFLTALGQKENIVGNYLHNLPIKLKLYKLNKFDNFFINGEKFENPLNLQKYITILQQRFPKEKNNITNFFEEIKNILFYYQVNISQKYAGLTFPKFLGLFFKDKLLKKVLSVFTIYIGENPNKSWAINSAALLGSIFYYGVYYPAKGMRALPQTLLKNLELFNGKIIYQARVTNIYINKQSVTSIKYRIPGKKNIILKADVVISNASLQHTFFDLITTSNLPIEFIKKISQIKPSMSGIIVQLGLKTLPKKYNNKSGIYFLTNKNQIHKNNSRNVFYAINISTNYSRIISLSKKTILRFATYLPAVQKRYYSRTTRKKFKTYYLKKIKSIFPDVTNNIEVSNILFPESYYKLTNNTAGAFVGSSNIPYKNQPPNILKGETPFRNLFLAGHWAHGMTGVQGAFVSGLLTARKIKNTFDKL